MTVGHLVPNTSVTVSCSEVYCGYIGKKGHKDLGKKCSRMLLNIG